MARQQPGGTARAPWHQTLGSWVEATVCADNGLAVKHAPEMVLHLCEALGVGPDRTAVVGDAPADLTMGRRAGAGLVIGSCRVSVTPNT